jgi:hypothetical protein
MSKHMQRLTHLSLKVALGSSNYPQRLHLPTLQDLRIDFIAVGAIVPCLNSLTTPNLQHLEILLRKQAPLHDEDYTGRSPCDLETGRFPHLTHLSIVWLPLCLCLQLVLRLRNSVMQYLGINAGRFGMCHGHHKLFLGDDKDVLIRTLQIRGLHTKLPRNCPIHNIITTSLCFPDIEDLYLDGPFLDYAPVSISSAQIDSISPKRVVIGDGSAYSIQGHLAQSTGLLSSITQTKIPSRTILKSPLSSSSSHSSPLHESSMTREVASPARVILTVTSVIASLYFTGHSGFPKGGLERVDEMNIVVGTLSPWIVGRIQAMLQSLNDGPICPAFNRSHALRSSWIRAPLIRTYKRAKWHLMRAIQPRPILYPELQKVSLHMIDGSMHSHLPVSIVKELKKMVRRRKGKGSLCEMRWNVAPLEKDLEWFKRHNISCSTTTNRDLNE